MRVKNHYDGVSRRKNRLELVITGHWCDTIDQQNKIPREERMSHEKIAS